MIKFEESGLNMKEFWGRVILCIIHYIDQLVGNTTDNYGTKCLVYDNFKASVNPII